MNGAVAIVQTAFPGDLILTSALVRSFRQGWPERRPVLVVRPDGAGIASMMEGEPEIVVWEKRGADAGAGGTRRVASRLRELGCTAALLPHRSTRTALLAAGARLKPRIGYDIGLAAVLHTDAVPYRRGVHEVVRQHDLLVRLAEREGMAPPALLGPHLVPTTGGREEAAEVTAALDAGHAHPYAVLAPGSVWPTKRWPERYWKQLASALAEAGLGIVWIGGPEDETRCTRMARATGIGVVGAGRLSWAGTAALLERARLLVANDSAPVHVASAVGCPTIALFGPTLPGFGFGPLAGGSRSLGVRIACRPCRIHGGSLCPEGHFRCMLDLSPGKVAESVADLIEAVYGREGEAEQRETVDAG